MDGAKKSEIWSRIVYDAAGVAIYKSIEQGAAALGASIIATVGCSAFADYADAAAAMVHHAKTLVPHTKNTSRVAERCVRYCNIWDALQKFYE